MRSVPKQIRCATTLLFFVSIINAQATAAIKNDTSVTLHSSILNEDITINISVPKGYTASTSGYPVVYVLDGQYNYSFTTEAAGILSNNSRIPPCIVVGINSNNRERDYTTALKKNWQPPVKLPSAGGALTYLENIEKEVIPYIQQHYRAEPYNVIIGHSLGGLCALAALAAKPALFQAYILLDASVWWNEGETVKSVIDYLNRHPDYKGKIFWGRDKIPHEVWFGQNTELLNYFEKNRPKNLQFTFTEMERETHSTLVFPGTYFGLRDIFFDYNYSFNEATNLDSLQSYYKELSLKYGYHILIPENVYMNLNFQLAHNKDDNKQLEVCKFWISDYANSFSANEALGKIYSQMGNREMAKKYFRAALVIQPNNKEIESFLH